MAEKVYVHIGLGKTGSSGIQRTIAANLERMRALDLDYPQLNGACATNHQRLAGEIIQKKDELWTEVRNHIQASKRDVVLSAEAFGGVPPQSLRDAIGDGPRVTVFYYVRPPAQRMPSYYSQNTKFGLNVAGFDTVFESERVGVSGRWRYAKFTETWTEVFPDAVRVRSLDPQALTRGDLMSDFLDACGREPEAASSFVVPKTKDLENVTPGWKLVESLRGLHSSVLGSPPAGLSRMQDPVLWPYLRRAFVLGSDIADKLGWSERRPYLSEEQLTRLECGYEEDRIRLQRMGVDSNLSMPGYDRRELIRDEMPHPDMVPVAERAEFLFHLAPELLKFQLRHLRRSSV